MGSTGALDPSNRMVCLLFCTCGRPLESISWQIPSPASINQSYALKGSTSAFDARLLGRPWSPADEFDRFLPRRGRVIAGMATSFAALMLIGHPYAETSKSVDLFFISEC